MRDLFLAARITEYNRFLIPALEVRGPRPETPKMRELREKRQLEQKQDTEGNETLSEKTRNKRNTNTGN